MDEIVFCRPEKVGWLFTMATLDHLKNTTLTTLDGLDRTFKVSLTYDK
jgi:hypothetical protein